MVRSHPEEPICPISIMALHRFCNPGTGVRFSHGAPLISLSFNEQDTMLRTWGWRFDSFQRYHKEHAMKMTKAVTISWIPSNDSRAVNLSHHARILKFNEMCLENKTVHYTVTINNSTVKRFFVDQAAVDEFLNFCRDLESIYQTKIDKIEIEDI